MRILVCYDMVTEYGAHLGTQISVITCTCVQHMQEILSANNPGKIVGISSFRILSEHGVRISKVIDLLHNQRVEHGDIEISNQGLILAKDRFNRLVFQDLSTVTRKDISVKLGAIVNEMRTSKNRKIKRWADLLSEITALQEEV